MKGGVVEEEVVPVEIKTRKGVRGWSTQDDHCVRRRRWRCWRSCRPRSGRTACVTAGNASGIVDGGAALMLASARGCRAPHGLKPLGRLVAWATIGVEPTLMGMGPAPATRKALDEGRPDARRHRSDRGQRGVRRRSIWRVEKELGLDRDKVNVNGGAIALGHPLGMSGTRLLLTLLLELRRRGGKRGLATACIGGGQGIAAMVETAGP